MRSALWYVLMLGMSCYAMCCVCSWRKGTRAVWSAPRTCGCVWGRTTPLDWPACLWRAALWGMCCCTVSHHQIPLSFPQTGTAHSHVSAKLWLRQVLNLNLTNFTPRCVPAWMKSINFRSWGKNTGRLSTPSRWNCTVKVTVYLSVSTLLKNRQI